MKWQKPDLTPNSIGRSSSHDGLDSGVPDNCVDREYCYSQNIQIIAIRMLCLDHIQTEVIPPGQLYSLSVVLQTMVTINYTVLR